MTHTDTAPHRLRRLTYVAAAAALVAASAAAAASPASAAPVPRSQDVQTSWVRATHLVSGLGAMDVTLVPFAGVAAGGVAPSGPPPAATVDGARVVGAAATYGAATEYRQVPAGVYSVQLRPAGSASSTAPVLTGILDARSDSAYTLAPIGTPDAPKVEVLSDDLRAPAQDTAHVRLLSASATAASVTVTAPDGAVVASGAQFAVPTGYDEVRPGRVALTAQVDGVSTGAGESTEVNFASGSTYTVLVLDRTGGGLELRALVDAAGMDSLPTGGVQTGGGGMAPSSDTRGPLVAGGLLLGLAGAAVLLGTAVGQRRRARPLTP